MNQKEIISLYENGASLETISKMTGCSIYKIKKEVLAAGIPLRKNPPGRKDIDAKEIIEMHERGETIYKIAKHFQCSAACVYSRLRQARPKRDGSEKKMCSCCGIRAVPKRPVHGHLLTRLCYRCFIGDGPEESGED